MKLTHLYADITKSEKDAESGDLMVTGIAASPTKDIDKQIADPEWLKSAMPAWMEWGNVREQHSKVAAGIGMELDQNGENWTLKAAVIDPVTATKVEKKVLKGFSIGIKGPRIMKDAAAPGGRIVGGEIVEISLVDRPANPDCRIDIAKSAGSSGDWEPVDAPEDDELDKKYADVELTKALITEHGPITTLSCVVDLVKGELVKRDYTDDERKDMAGKGQALPGGGFPIKNEADLKNAVQAVGRAKDPTAARAHIKKRAAALGASGLVPDTWKAATTDEWTHDPAQVAETFKSLLALLKAEIDEWAKGEDERWDVQQLLEAACLVASWAQDEAREGEIPPPFDQGDMSMLTFGIEADIIKAATADDATDEAKDKLHAELQKALGVDAESLGEKIAAVLPDAVKGLFEERSTALEERLARVEGAAAPGGPVTTRTNAESAKASQADHMRAQAAHYRQIADNVDYETAKPYRQKAAECDAAASKLAGV